MYDHIGLRVKDLDAATRFYEAALEALGGALCSRDDAGASFGPSASAPMLYLSRADAPGAATHVAFTARDHAAVARFHAAGLAAGGRDNGPPGPRPDYSPTYYAAFLLDPDGNNVEAVCP